MFNYIMDAKDMAYGFCSILHMLWIVLGIEVSFSRVENI